MTYGDSRDGRSVGEQVRRSLSTRRTRKSKPGKEGPRIEHVAVWVRDLDRVCAFYADHFGAVVGALYRNPIKAFASRFLAFGSGARIEVMTTAGLTLRQSKTRLPPAGFAHLAFTLESEAAVDALTARFKSQGIRVVDGPRLTGDGYYESVVLDPEGNRVELAAIRGR
jgi:lactoylglutathione lyase